VDALPQRAKSYLAEQDKEVQAYHAWFYRDGIGQLVHLQLLPIGQAYLQLDLGLAHQHVQRHGLAHGFTGLVPSHRPGLHHTPPPCQSGQLSLASLVQRGEYARLHGRGHILLARTIGILRRPCEPVVVRVRLCRAPPLSPVPDVPAHERSKTLPPFLHRHPRTLAVHAHGHRHEPA
jgi:hypothetical protein